MTPAIGRLRRRLTIQAESPSADGLGGQARAWTDVATVWARVVPLSGSEQLHGMQLEARISHRITIRHRADVTARHRLRLGGRVFNIRAAVDREERGRWLELLCEEGVAT